jgi:hypothetical protein
MKTISNRLKTILLSSLSLMLALVVITPAFAHDLTSGSGGAKPQEAATVCAHILALSTSSKSTIATKQSELQADFSKRLAAISSRQAAVDSKVTAYRTDASAKFDAKIQSLQAETGLTDVQKAAIGTYKTSVQSAESVRETAVDSARSAYRTGLATVVANQQQALSTASLNYQSTVNAAFSTASADCTTTSAATVMSILRAAVKAARATLDTARTPDTTKVAIQQLATTRDASFKTANSAFLTTLTGLTATLKTSLGVSTTASATSTTPTKQ